MKLSHTALQIELLNFSFSFPLAHPSSLQLNSIKRHFEPDNCTRCYILLYLIEKYFIFIAVECV